MREVGKISQAVGSQIIVGWVRGTFLLFFLS